MSTMTESSQTASSGLPTQAASAMIEADQLSKFYGEFVATKNVTFKVPKGEVVAFLGPNGAGKSTTMKRLTGFLTPTHGRAMIGGYDMAEHRLEAARLLGYLPENGPLYGEMTPRSFLAYCGAARGMESRRLKDRMAYVADQCALTGVWEKSISKLSKGYRQRVGMAQAILHDPEVLILDEPSSGLDPNQTLQARELIRKLGQTKTILLSTHILYEVQAVASRVILINAGKVILDGPVSQLSGSVTELEEKFSQLTGGAKA